MLYPRLSPKDLEGGGEVAGKLDDKVLHSRLASMSAPTLQEPPIRATCEVQEAEKADQGTGSILESSVSTLQRGELW